MSSFEENNPTWVCLLSTLLYTGAQESTIDRMLFLVQRTFSAGGDRALASLIKGWSKCMRSILSNNAFDTSTVGYCKLPRNCRHSFRQAGLSESEISQIITKYGDNVGIPPFLFDPAYVRVLLPNPGIHQARVVNPFANIGRTAPVADAQKCKDSVISFFHTTSVVWPYQFDFSLISHSYAHLCSGEIPQQTRWSAGFNSSYDYPRSKDGKLGEVIQSLIHEFMFKTVDMVFPVCPDQDLYDMLGNLALKSKDWSVGVPLTDVMYPDYSSGAFIDQRFGLFGFIWAIHDIKDRYPDNVDSNSEWFSIGPRPPDIQFSGSICSRVNPLAEEGFKARVITVPPFSVALLQKMLRHILDPFVRRDKNIKIGLLSAVKLYDLMVQINGTRRGVDTDGFPSLWHRCCESADLTTATDTPYHKAIRTIVRPFVEKVLGPNLMGFYNFVLDIAFSPREFENHLKPDDWNHECGIMMGEGLSGVYLNVMSGIVRTYVNELKSAFDWYFGTTIADADEFISDHPELIQEFLSSRDISRFDPDSSQSGDDLIGFNEHRQGELRPFLVLFYRILGLIPSESTFYSSESFGTFTEESCYKDNTTLGWVFLDCLKPRLFNPACQESLNSVLSRIGQITSKLRYQAHDQELVGRVSYCVDLLLSNNIVISERIDRYGLVPEFPAFLGGLDHPRSLVDGIQFDINDIDRQLLVYLRDCDDEELFEVKYHYISEEIDDEFAQALRLVLKDVITFFSELCVSANGEIAPLLTIEQSELAVRSDYVGWAEYHRDIRRIKADTGLGSLDEIIEIIKNGYLLRDQLHENVNVVPNPMIRLRNRREFLVSRIPPGTEPHDFMWSDIRLVQSRIQNCFQGRITPVRSFLEALGLDDLPNMICPVNLSIGGVI